MRLSYSNNRIRHLRGCIFIQTQTSEYMCTEMLSAYHKHNQTSAKHLSFPMWHGHAFQVVVMGKQDKIDK